MERCCVREFWAVIERDASLVRGRNVLRTAKLGPGIYEVFFCGPPLVITGGTGSPINPQAIK